VTATAPADWRIRTQQAADGIRRRVFRHTLEAGGGYLSQACSSAEIFAMLYTQVLHLGPSTAPLIPRPFLRVPGPGGTGFETGGAYNGPKAPEYDRFVFSPSHYALVLYSTLIEVGRLAEEALEEFNRDGSTVEMIGAEHSPGIETTTGSLGQALSQAGGIALARRLHREPGQVWVMMSDGEFQEGQTWEAVATSAWHGLNNLRVVVDVNGQQCDGCMQNVSNIEPLADRLCSFGATVDDVDGHDLDALHGAMTRPTDKPHFVLARTDPIRGVPLFAERAPLLHYLRYTSEEERARYQAAYDEMVRS
jgi:transketolase